MTPSAAALTAMSPALRGGERARAGGLGMTTLTITTTTPTAGSG